MHCFFEFGEFFLLIFSYCVSICRCSLSSVEDWFGCQLFCHKRKMRWGQKNDKFGKTRVVVVEEKRKKMSGNC
jgi:hypothetical protein